MPRKSNLRAWHGPLAMIVLFSIPAGAWSQGEDAERGGRRIRADRIPLPADASDVRRDASFEEITLQSRMGIAELAQFYQRSFEALEWSTDDEFDPDDEDVDLCFEKQGREIDLKLELDSDSGVVSITIDGDGIRWGSAGQTMNGFPADEVPLLENQSVTRDGSTELLQFNSRRSVDENIEHFQNWMASEDWKLAETRQQDGATLLRFEKDDVYLRFGLWPHSFSDNLGRHEGTGGAMTGTGLTWSGRPGSKDVPARLAAEAEKFTKMTPAQHQALTDSLRESIEKILSGREGPYSSK